jgi:hypothetical protein
MHIGCVFLSTIVVLWISYIIVVGIVYFLLQLGNS